MRLHFDIHTWWHIGTGRGDAAVADAVVARDAAGLPYLPGRAVKGLLRDAADLGVAAGHLDPAQAKAVFGKRVATAATPEEAEEQLERGRFAATGDGTVFFGSATLPETWRAWAAAQSRTGATEGVIEALFTRVASTRIDENGVADDQTLRVIQVTAPMRLTAVLDGLHGAPAQWQRFVAGLCPYVKLLGADRNRGLGRVALTAEVAP